LDTGFIKTRRGSRNTNISRYFLDEIYALKNPMEKSEFRIYGLDNEYITENIKLKEFNYLPNIFDEKEKLTNLLEKINNIIINDYNDDGDEKKFNISSNIGLYSKIGFPSTKKEVDAEIVNNIDSFAKEIGFKINDDFYKLGNLRERFTGIKASNLLNISQGYEIEGSKMSKEKYKLILELDMQLKKTISWAKFINDIKDFRYLELAIKEIGNTADEEIEINVELPKDCYIDYEKFPKANSVIVKEINKKYSEYLFKPSYNSGVSDFRRMPLSTPGNTYIPSIDPFSKAKVEIIEGMYNYIDYNVIENKDKTILNFTIKNLKKNEIMAFPGKIIIKNSIKEINYSIISKKNKEKVEGILIIKN
jgi:hypothetical protein